MLRHKKSIPPVGYSDTHKNDLIPIKTNDTLRSCFTSIASLFSPTSHVLSGLIKLKLEELVLNLLIQPGNEHVKSIFATFGNRRKTNLKQIMISNFRFPLNILDYARLTTRSLSSFRRDFKETFHTTPGKWLLQKRLEYSRFLLETTDESVSSVCFDSGFKNRSHFIKSFTKFYGMAPAQFRKQKLLKEV